MPSPNLQKVWPKKERNHYPGTSELASENDSPQTQGENFIKSESLIEPQEKLPWGNHIEIKIRWDTIKHEINGLKRDKEKIKIAMAESKTSGRIQMNTVTVENSIIVGEDGVKILFILRSRGQRQDNLVNLEWRLYLTVNRYFGGKSQTILNRSDFE